MAVKPSSNNRFGRGSLVSDIAGVGKTAKRAVSAEDIIKKQQEKAQKDLVENEVQSTAVKEAEEETQKEPTYRKEQSDSSISPAIEHEEAQTLVNVEPPVRTVAPSSVTQPSEIPGQVPTPQFAYTPQQNIYQAGQNHEMNPYTQPVYYNQYQEPYQTTNFGYSQDIQNAELHKTTNYNIFEDYPDINVRLPIKTGGDREMLKKSILESGIADPIIVAPVNDVIRAFQAVNFLIPNYPGNVQFIIIAGQNRRSIAKELNIELPFIIKRGLSKEQMDAIGLDTNLLNRQFSAMKPSEQVYIVNRRRALFEQNNTRNIRGKLSEITGYEKTYIYQLLSLVNVKRELLTDFVDPGYISVSGITHLVSVPYNNQELLYDYLIRYNVRKLMASQMKALLQDTTSEWTDAYLNGVLFPNSKKLSNITLRPDQYQNIIPEDDYPRATEIILEALKEYYSKNR